MLGWASAVYPLPFPTVIKMPISEADRVGALTQYAVLDVP